MGHAPPALVACWPGWFCAGTDARAGRAGRTNDCAVLWAVNQLALAQYSCASVGRRTAATGTCPVYGLSVANIWHTHSISSSPDRLGKSDEPTVGAASCHGRNDRQRAGLAKCGVSGAVLRGLHRAGSGGAVAIAAGLRIDHGAAAGAAVSE